MDVAAAALTAWGLGAGWYGLFARQWARASKVDPANTTGRGHPLLPHAVALLGALASSAMVSHIFDLCKIVDDPVHGLKAGLGMGAAMVLPWIANTVLYAGRDWNLVWLDGGYPVLAMGAIGLVLNLL